jgi:hypothetical protein
MQRGLAVVSGKEELASLVGPGQNPLICSTRSLLHLTIVTFFIAKTGLASPIATGGRPMLTGDLNWRRPSLSFEHVVEGSFSGRSGIGKSRGPKGQNG